MRLATLRDGTRDGTLIVVANTEAGLVFTPAPIGTLQAALDGWAEAELALRQCHEQLVYAPSSGTLIDTSTLMAPLARAYQWAEGSTYLVHMERLRQRGESRSHPGHGTDPAVYQAASDAFLGPLDPIELGDESWGLDLEATVAVMTDDVPRETAVADAGSHIKLVALANDLTYRHLLTKEYAVGVGFYQAKPIRPLAPFVRTPEDLGTTWSRGMLHATVRTWVNRQPLGVLDSGRDSAFSFPELIAHMTRTRPLAAGTIIGSGTVANRDASAGFGCLAEQRAAELERDGTAVTPLLRAGDGVRVEAFGPDGESLFGAIDQTVVTRQRMNP